MKQVKGTMLKAIVKAIRADKSGQYDNILSDKAKVFINQRILDSIWYPFKLYKECFNALSKINARGNKNVLVEWGKAESEKIMPRVYSHIIIKGDPTVAMEKYARFHKMVFDFGEIQYEQMSDNQIIVDYKDFEPDFENFYYIAIGWIEKFIQLCIDKIPNYELLKKSWEGDDFTQFELSWIS